MHQTENYGGNCVYYAQFITFGRIGLGWGAGGRNLPIDSTPEIGDIVVFTYTHVAKIIDIQNGVLTLTESNYVHGQITRGRQIAEGNPTIRGYYHPSTAY